MVNMPGQNVDDRLLGFGGNDGQEDEDEGSSDQGDTTGNPQSWARQLGVKKQVKSLSKNVGKVSEDSAVRGLAEAGRGAMGVGRGATGAVGTQAAKGAEATVRAAMATYRGIAIIVAATTAFFGSWVGLIILCGLFILLVIAYYCSWIPDSMCLRAAPHILQYGNTFMSYLNFL